MLLLVLVRQSLSVLQIVPRHRRCCLPTRHQRWSPSCPHRCLSLPPRSGCLEPTSAPQAWVQPLSPFLVEPAPVSSRTTPPFSVRPLLVKRVRLLQATSRSAHRTVGL